MLAMHFRGTPGVATAGLCVFGHCPTFSYTGDGIELLGVRHGVDRTDRTMRLAGRASRSNRFGTTLK